VFQNSRDLRIAARASMLQRRGAVPVGKGDVGTGLDQGRDRGRVVAATIAEHDRLEQGGAAEIVGVVERRLGRDQGAHDLHVPAMGGGDQRSVVIGTGDGARIAAALERDLQQFEVVVHGRDGDDVVALGIERVWVGAEPDEGARCRILAQKRGYVQRRAAVGVLNVGLFALGDQLLDLSGVAARGGVVEAGIDAQLPLARRRLREACGAGELGCANRHQSKKDKTSRHGCVDRGCLLVNRASRPTISRSLPGSAFLRRYCCKILRRFDLALAPSLPSLEFKSGDFKPSLIAASSLSTARLALRGWRGPRRRWGPTLLCPPTRRAQFGMRSTGLIVVPCEESCAARLISA